MSNKDLVICNMSKICKLECPHRNKLHQKNTTCVIGCCCPGGLDGAVCVPVKQGEPVKYESTPTGCDGCLYEDVPEDMSPCVLCYRMYSGYSDLYKEKGKQLCTG